MARPLLVLAMPFPRRACLKGQQVDRAGGPSPLLSRPAWGEESLHPMGEWLGQPGEATGSVCWWLLRLLVTHGASSPGRRRPEGREADFSLYSGTGQLPSSCPWQSVSGGPLWPLPPLPVPASQEAFPEGLCISMVTVFGVPAPASPNSAPSRRARWKTTLRGSHSRCDLSLPARK